MALLSIAVDDARLRAWARRNPEAVRRGMKRFLGAAGALAVREMKLVMRERFGRIGVKRAGLGPKTGATGASVKAFRAPNNAYVLIGPNTPYAAAVDTGSRPHVIRPRRARFLRFTTQFSVARDIALPGGVNLGKKVFRGKNTVFAKEVHHPGFRGHHFVRRTSVRVEPRLRPMLERFIQQEMTR